MTGTSHRLWTSTAQAKDARLLHRTKEKERQTAPFEQPRQQILRAQAEFRQLVHRAACPPVRRFARWPARGVRLFSHALGRPDSSSDSNNNSRHLPEAAAQYQHTRQTAADRKFETTCCFRCRAVCSAASRRRSFSTAAAAAPSPSCTAMRRARR